MFNNRNKISRKMLYLYIVNIILLINQIDCHARMDEPPSRNSAWRFGFKIPQNYNDCELNCGGAGRQHANNGGRCGICGDPYDVAIKQHEYGGIYATGTIVRAYSMGEIIKIGINITSNHLGTMEFKVCPLDNMRLEATQECLDQNVLDIVGHGKYYNVGASDRELWLTLKLSDGLHCEHCVLQWKYRGGNNWGSLPDGKNGLGIGPQEEFYNCADISILPSDKTEKLNPIFTIESLITTTVPLITTTPPLLTLPSKKVPTTFPIQFVSSLQTTSTSATTESLATITTVESNLIYETSTVPMEIITKKYAKTEETSLVSQLSTTNEIEVTKVNVFLITDSKEDLVRDEMTTLSTPILTITTPKAVTLSKKFKNKSTLKSKLKLHVKHRTSKSMSTITNNSSKRTLISPIVLAGTGYVQRIKPIMFGCGRLEKPLKTRTVTQNPPYQGSLYCHLIGDTQTSCKECYENCSSPLKECPETDCHCKWYA